MARRVSLCVLAVLCLCFILQTNVALGQAVFGSVIGSVTDAQGAVVAGAKVTVTYNRFDGVATSSGNGAGTNSGSGSFFNFLGGDDPPPEKPRPRSTRAKSASSQ